MANNQEITEYNGLIFVNGQLDMTASAEVLNTKTTAPTTIGVAIVSKNVPDFGTAKVADEEKLGINELMTLDCMEMVNEDVHQI